VTKLIILSWVIHLPLCPGWPLVIVDVVLGGICFVLLFYRVFSSYIKEIDEKPGATEWGSRMPFANLMAEFTSAAGVNATMLVKLH